MSDVSNFLLVVLALGLLFLSGVFSGLNVGMMMVKPADLRRKAKHGDKLAQRVYRYRKDGYYLIFCILLGNVGVNTAMSILLGNLTNGLVGGLIATLMITAFGEILPQAIFAQRGYRLVRHFFWLLDAIYVLFWPLASPVSRLIGRFLGSEPPQLYTHDELEEIINEHAASKDSLVDQTESRIITGALRFSSKTVANVMTPLKQVYSLSLNAQLDTVSLNKLKRQGKSRIPVRFKNQFVGLLYVKDLVGRSLPIAVAQVYRDRIHDIYSSSRLDTALSRFMQTRSHLFVVLDDDDCEIGIVTLEDVIEEIVNQEIEDEYDIS